MNWRRAIPRVQPSSCVSFDYTLKRIAFSHADMEIGERYRESVFQMRTAPALMRASFAALFGLLLAIRLLAPAGFMPSFEHGAVTIVACPEATPGPPPMAGHQHRHSQTVHQPCPYASASGLGALGADFVALLDVMVFAAALLLGRTFLFLERNSFHERPPTRGPPIAA